MNKNVALNFMVFLLSLAIYGTSKNDFNSSMAFVSAFLNMIAVWYVWEIK